jgi:hypothetical protein
MAAKVIITGPVTKVTVWWLQGEIGDGDSCRTNIRADRGLYKVDAGAAYIGIQWAYLVI